MGQGVALIGVLEGQNWDWGAGAGTSVAFLVFVLATGRTINKQSTNATEKLKY